MPTFAKQEPRYHILLVGIDRYSVKPLSGCVNDIDAVQRLLIEKAGLAPGRISRLASPHSASAHDTSIPSAPATLDNIRAALTALASEEVASDDRVFIYYSGHGARSPVAVDGETVQRESLVPVDFNADPVSLRLLYDFELNHLLSRIASRTRAFTFILDCCHSTGATRELADQTSMTPRFIDPQMYFRGARGPDIGSQMLIDQPRGLKGIVDDCQVIAACLNHELAQEAVGSDGVRHGLLTRALIGALDSIHPGELRSVPWGRIWHRVIDDVSARNPWQHPWMSGTPARAVLAGPPLDGDVGIGVRRTSENEYRLEAGTISGITKGARVAIYGNAPFHFPRLDSAKDLAARANPVLLEVIDAGRSTALAKAEGPAFELPEGARGRLVRAGGSEKLRCAIVPSTPALAKQVAESPLLEVVSEKEAEVRLEQGPGDRWSLTDDVHGAKPGYPVLFTLEEYDIEFVREVLEHYQRYARPLRMAARCTDLPGALQVALFACPKEHALTPEEAQLARLPEVRTEREFDYELTAGDRFCVRVRNGSGERLRATLLNSAASGKVQVLGDQIIDSRSFHVFWAGSQLGSPFRASLPAGATQCIDRMVVIGTTAVENDIKFVRVDRGFVDIVRLLRSRSAPKDIDDTAEFSAPVERWTAAQVTIRTQT